MLAWTGVDSNSISQRPFSPSLPINLKPSTKSPWRVPRPPQNLGSTSSIGRRSRSTSVALSVAQDLPHVYANTQAKFPADGTFQLTR